MNQPRAPRGYALAIVLLVAVLLSAALSSMFFALSSATKLTAKNLGARRAQYVCDGVVALAGHELRRASFRSTTLTSLNAALDPLRRGIVSDGVVIDELRADATTDARRTVVPSGGLAGMEVAVVDLDLRIALRSVDAPPCRARHVQPLASVSVFQFPAFSIDNLAIPTGPNRSVDVPGHSAYAWARAGASVPASVRSLQGRSTATAPLALPEAPDHISPTPTDLRFLIQPPGSGHAVDVVDPPPEPRNARLAFAADLRILDGEWFLRDPTDESAWPGVPLWSDHPCTNPRSVNACSNVVGSGDPRWLDDTLALRRLYSRYERNGRGFLDGSGGAGVVSYGGVTGSVDVDPTEPAGFAPASLCSNDPGTFRRPGACTSTAPEKDGPRAALADAARAGFRDPHLDLPRTPINIDVGVLGAAMATLGRGELGDALCLPTARGVPGLCRRVFNGIVYVSARRGTPATSTPPFSPIASDTRVGGKLPWPLCGRLSSAQTSLESGERPGYFTSATQRDCDDDAAYARIDSVRLLRADDLSAFLHTGLTIVTDLPVYLQRNWNAGGITGAGARTAIIAERITVVSALFNDSFAPPLGVAAIPMPVTTPRVILRGSIFAGSVASDVSALVRVMEPRVDVVVEGGLAIGFRSAVVPDDHRANRFTWRYPSPLFSGSPAEQPPGAPRASFVMPGARRP